MNRSASSRFLWSSRSIFSFLEDQNGARRQSSGIAHAERLAGQRTLAEKLAGSEHRHDGFSAVLDLTDSFTPPFGCT
jgi:hypothetical protein